MKLIYQRLKCSALFALVTKKIVFASVVIFLTGSSITVAQELVFKNPTLVSGSARQDNAVYRFPYVSSTLDALVKVKKRSASNVIIENMDVTDFGWNKAFQPRIGINGGVVSGTKDWWVEFEITFVKAGTFDRADVDEFNVTSLDVDGDGLTIREYVEIYGAASYYCEAGTELNNVAINNDDDDDDSKSAVKNYRMLGPVKNYLNIDTAGTKVMVTSRFLKQNQIKVKIGARSMGLGTSNAAIRYNSLWFRSFNYKSPAVLPVKLTSFTAKTLNEGKVSLYWNTEHEKNSSHFTIEKSLNGKDFSDAGILFTTGNSELPQQYSFTDNLRAGEKGVVYYRLKIVDLDGKAQHSSVKAVRVGEEKVQVSMSLYPNPVANDLRVTLPASWHDKKVAIDIYSTNGVLVKRFVTNNASEIETINVSALQPGSYVVRSVAGTEMLSKSIIKSN